MPDDRLIQVLIDNVKDLKSDIVRVGETLSAGQDALSEKLDAYVLKTERHDTEIKTLQKRADTFPRTVLTVAGIVATLVVGLLGFMPHPAASTPVLAPMLTQSSRP